MLVDEATSGTLTLGGAGAVQINGGFIKASSATGQTLKNNGNMISGFGQIGDGSTDSDLTLNNNAGTIEALDGTLTLFTKNTITNAGGATLEAASGAVLQIDDTAVTNSGNILLDGELALGLTNQLLTLSGAGTVTLAGGGFEGLSTGDTLFNNGNTISGFGTIGSGLNNLQNGNVSAGGGTIKAVGGTLVLALNSGQFITNNVNAIFEASGSGAVLQIDNSINNSGGLILATGGGEIDVQATAITSSGTVQNSNGFELAGSADIFMVDVGSGGTLTLKGSIFSINGGTIEAAAANETLMDGTSTSGGTTIIGFGRIGNGTDTNLIFNGSSSSIVDAAGGTLTLETGNAVTNVGILEATAGGILQINDVVNNSDLIEATGTNSELDIKSGTINWTGGTATPNFNGIILASASDVLLVDTTLFDFNGGALWLSGSTIKAAAAGETFENNGGTVEGVGTIGDGSSKLTLTNINGGLIETAAGSGTLTLNTGNAININSGELLVQSTATMVLDDNVSIGNGGNLTDAGTLELGTTNGTLTVATGGVFNLNSSISALIEGLASGETLTNNGGTITALGFGTTQIGDGTGHLSLNNASGTLQITQGTLLIDTGTAVLNSGTISVSSGQTLTFDDAAVTNSGNINISGTMRPGVANEALAIGGGGNIALTGATIASTQTGTAFTNTNNTITATGTSAIGDQSGRMTFTNSAGGTVEVQSGTLTLKTGSSAGSATVTNAGTLEALGGSLTLNDNVSNSGTLEENGGTITFNSGAKLTNTGTSGNLAKVDVETGTLTLATGNTDTFVSYTGAGTVNFSGARTIGQTGNADGSSVTIANTQFAVNTTTVNATYAVTSTTLNGGTLTLNSNGTTGTLLEENSSSVLSGTGKLMVTGLATFTSGSTTESGTGTTLLEGGASIAASNSFSLTMSRTLELQGTSTVTGTTGGTIAVTSPGQLKLDAGTVLNPGVFNDESGTAGTGLIIGGTGTVANSGEWEKTVGAGTSTVSASFSSTGVSGTPAVVDVETGVLDLSGGGADVFTSYSGTGTIDFGGGTRTIGQTGNTDGSSITTANVQFNGGSTTVNGSYAAGTSTTVNGGSGDLKIATAGLGTLSFTTGGGTLNLEAAAATAASLMESGGTLTGTGELTVTGAATFTANSYTESGTGTTLVEGGASIAASTSLSLSLSRTLELQSTSTVTGTGGGGGIALGTSGTLKIDSGATFDEASGSTTTTDLTISGTTGAVSNAGTFEKTVGTGTTTVNATFNDTGTSGNLANVQVATGTLDLSGGGADVFTSYSGAGTIDFGGGTRTLDTNSSITSANVVANGGMTTDNGSYNVTSTTINGGTLILNGTSSTTSFTESSSGTLGGTGTLTVTGNTPATFTAASSAENGTGTTLLEGGASFATGGNNLSLVLTSRTLELQGTSTVTGTTGGTIAVTSPGQLKLDAGTVLNPGVFNDESGTAGTGLIIGGTGTVANSGEWEKTVGAGTSTVSASFSSTGVSGTPAVVDVETGVLDLSGGGADVFTSYSGTGTIDFGGGTRTIGQTGNTDGSSITTANVQFNGGSTTVNGSYAAGTSTTVNGGSGDLKIATAGLGTLSFTTGGGTLNLEAAAATAASLMELGGTLTGTGELTVTGAATFTANSYTESGTGTTLVEGGASIAASTSLSLSLSRTLELQSTSTVTGTGGGGGIALGTSGTLKIDSGATFDEASGSTTTTDLTISGTTGAVSNAGTFEKTVGTGTTTVSAVFTNNASGVINAASGTLKLTGGLTNNGELEVSGGMLDVTTAISGTGTVLFSGTGTFELAQLSGFGETIGGFANADTLDLGGFNSTSGNTFTTSTSYNGTNTTLIITDTTKSTSASVTLAGNYTGTLWAVTSDGSGGADVTESAPTPDNWNQTTGNWATAADWSTGALPGATNEAVLGGSTAYTVTSSGAVTVNELISTPTSTLDITGGTFTVANYAGQGPLGLSGGTLNIGSSAANVASLTQTGGTLTGTGEVTVTGPATLGASGAYVVESGSGTTDLQGTSTLSPSSTFYFALDGGRVLQNDGTFNWASGAIGMGTNPVGSTVGGSTINNSLGAIFNDEVAGSITNGTGTNVFNNTGTFETSFTSGTATIGVGFNNTGTVNVGTGDTLKLSNGGGSIGGSFTGAGTLQFSNGYNFDSNSTVSIANVLFSGGTNSLAGTYDATNTTLSGGTLTAGANPITLATNFTQTGGTLSGTGKVTVTGSAALGASGAYVVESGSGTTDLQGTSTLSPSSTFYFALDGGRVLQNDGTFNWASGAIEMGTNPVGSTVGGSTINNSLGAIFNDEVAGSITNVTGTNVFNNTGTFETSFTSGITTIGVTFNNTGTVNAQSGTLELSGGGTETGTFNVSSGAIVQLNSAITLNGASSTGLGQVQLVSSTLTANSGVNFGSGFAQTGGTLTGTGEVTVTGPATLGASGAYVVESGSGTTDLQGTSTLSPSSTFYFALDGGRVLQNDGTFNWASGAIGMGTNPVGSTVGGSTINNSLGAIFNDEVAGSITNGTGTNVFNNTGTFETSFTSGTATIGVGFNNTGTVNVGTGDTLKLSNGGGSIGGSFTGAGTLQFSNGYNFDSNSTVSIANVLFSGGTNSLAGTYDATNTTLSGGTLTAGANPITLATNFTQTGGTLSGTGKVTVTGSAALGASGAYVVESGSGTTDLQGTSTLSPSSTFYFALDGGRVLQNDGTFNWASGAIEMGTNPVGSTVGGSTINNSLGAIFNDEVAGSITNVTGTNVFNNTGTFETSFTSGITTIGVTFNNTGTVNAQSGTLELSGGGTETGTFNVSSGAIVQLNSAITLNGASSTGLGQVQLVSSTLTANSGVNFGSGFAQTGGTLTGTGEVTVTGPATLGASGAYVVESGSGTTDLQGTSTLSPSSTFYFALDGGRVLQNDGTFNWASGAIGMGTNPVGSTVGGSTINNSLGAIFNDEVAGSITNGTGTNVFNNTGTFETSFTSGTATIGVGFNNTGTVNVEAGALDISNAATGVGGYQIGTSSGGTATLEFDSTVASGATITFEGSAGVSAGVLYLTDPTGFQAQIAISGSGDILDLHGYNTSTVASTTGGYNIGTNTTTLTITDSGHTTLQYTLAGDLSLDSWTVSPDSHGTGVDIVDPPPTDNSSSGGSTLSVTTGDPPVTLVNDAPIVIADGVTTTISSSSSDTVSFTSSTGSLVLNNPEGFTGQIMGFTGTAPDAAHSDTIDLVGINYNSSHFTKSYNSLTGLLTVTDGTNSANITFDNFNATLDFTSDGNGGTLITDPPTKGSAADASEPSSVASENGHVALPIEDADASHTHGNLSVGVPNEGTASGTAGSPFMSSHDQIDLELGRTLTPSEDAGVANAQNTPGTPNQLASVSIGGYGNDQFVFVPGVNANSATNFNANHDTVDPATPPRKPPRNCSHLSLHAHGDAIINPGHIHGVQPSLLAASATAYPRGPRLAALRALLQNSRNSGVLRPQLTV